MRYITILRSPMIVSISSTNMCCRLGKKMKRQKRSWRSWRRRREESRRMKTGKGIVGDNKNNNIDYKQTAITTTVIIIVTIITAVILVIVLQYFSTYSVYIQSNLFSFQHL